ncbi:MAG TPA: hypothetical protein VM661_16900 [Candidatus Sulfotelmatobacter sp.]|nr:hypothetical protein [Candidatus Sulfotelmatobacter sp.]
MPHTSALPLRYMPTDGLQLTTVEILYQTPGRPHLIQSFLWQDYDIAPEYPHLTRFLHFWAQRFDVTVHSVHMTEPEELGSAMGHYVGYSLVVH